MQFGRLSLLSLGASELEAIDIAETGPGLVTFKTGPVYRTYPQEKLPALADMAPGEGRIVEFEGKKMGIYKDEFGKVYAIDPGCTHIKCTVQWNNAEKSWDCPCHGSRFSYTGEVLTGPARKSLAVYDVKVGKVVV